LYQKSNSLNFNPLPKQRFADCLKLILASHAPSAQDLENQNFELLQQEAFEVYSLMHARYIRSPEGKQPPLLYVQLYRFGNYVQTLPSIALWLLLEGSM
jgi:hypothetical protein